MNTIQENEMCDLSWEEWKDIVGYEWLYQISDMGRVRSYDKKPMNTGENYYIKKGWKGRILKDYKEKTWYVTIALSKELRRKTFHIHRLVCKSFLENKENKPQVNHKNWVKNDNRLVNLERCTRTENMQHAIKVLWIDLGSNNRWKYYLYKWRTKTVVQKDLDWNVIKIWEWTRAVERWTGIPCQNISFCCLGKQSHSHWYIREYA